MATATVVSSTQPVPSSVQICSGHHKTRLLIGEGNFSFALALIHKHDTKHRHPPESSLAHSITATELKAFCDSCNHTYSDLSLAFIDPGVLKQILCNTCAEIAESMEELEDKGAKVKLKINGLTIDQQFKGKTFSRIHWNCPHDGSSYQQQSLPPIIESFFSSCAKVQNPKDRVHITLAQPPDKWAFYQGYIYNIARAASLAGYQILKKRRFDDSRYPGYHHVQTNRDTQAAVTDQGMREFVFQKMEPAVFRRCLQAAEQSAKNALESSGIRVDPHIFLPQEVTKSSEKTCQVRSKHFNNPPEARSYFYCSTDEDSSDCESS